MTKYDNYGANALLFTFIAVIVVAPTFIIPGDSYCAKKQKVLDSYM